jgi:membrane-bound metal-dependent hydrolase YbcI (DUF457 family)
MFIGHVGVGLAAKSAAPRASLGLLLTAALLPDLLWPVFLITGWEQVRIEPGNTAFTPLAFVHYPISHSLLAVAGWAVLFAGVYYAVTRDRAGAAIMGAAVSSHWFLDAVVHRPDLPIWPGSDLRAGLGLWNQVAGTVALEGLLFVSGAWLYLRQTRARDRAGRYAPGAFLLALVLLYAGNVAGPPPPGPQAIAAANLGGLLLLFWAAWFDRHRDTRIKIRSRAGGGFVQ